MLAGEAHAARALVAAAMQRLRDERRVHGYLPGIKLETDWPHALGTARALPRLRVASMGQTVPVVAAVSVVSQQLIDSLVSNPWFRVPPASSSASCASTCSV